MNKKILVVIISGTPGTGKTTIARKIAAMHKLKYIAGESLIRKYALSEGYDPLRKCKIVNPNKFSKAMKQVISSLSKETKGVVFDSHLSHVLSSKVVDHCIITKCKLSVLKKRLVKRKYAQKKIRENLDAEIFDVCYMEALEKGHKVRIVDTTTAINPKVISSMISP